MNIIIIIIVPFYSLSCTRFLFPLKLLIFSPCIELTWTLTSRLNKAKKIHVCTSSRSIPPGPLPEWYQITTLLCFVNSWYRYHLEHEARWKVNNYALIWVLMNLKIFYRSDFILSKMILSLPILVFCCEQEWDVIFSFSFFCGKHQIDIFLSLVPIYKPEVQLEWSIFPKNTSQTWTLSSQEVALLLVSTKDHDLWPDLIFWAWVFFVLSAKSHLTKSPWIADFQCWNSPEVTIIGAKWTEQSLSGWEWNLDCSM